MSAGGLLIERDGNSLLIDTGVGTTATDFALGGVDCGSMIDVLEAIGRRTEDIDVVAFTHLHFDHAGWAYAHGAKTFPNARYVLAAQEWAPYENGNHRGDATTPWHVIWQLASECNSLDLIDDGVEILPGVRAIVTPGHSPGHTTYVITSRTGQRLVAFGDAFHTPAQLTHPEWLSVADSDTTGVQMARRRLLAELGRAEHSRVRLSFRRSSIRPTHHRRRRGSNLGAGADVRTRPAPASAGPPQQLGNAKSHELSAQMRVCICSAEEAVTMARDDREQACTPTSRTCAGCLATRGRCWSTRHRDTASRSATPDATSADSSSRRRVACGPIRRSQPPPVDRAGRTARAGSRGTAGLSVRRRVCHRADRGQGGGAHRAAKASPTPEAAISSAQYRERP